MRKEDKVYTKHKGWVKIENKFRQIFKSRVAHRVEK